MGDVSESTGDVSTPASETCSGEDVGLADLDSMADDFLYIRLGKNEIEQLSAKTAEVLREAALAYERIAKDQEEIEQLKLETRAMLTRLRAA